MFVLDLQEFFKKKLNRFYNFEEDNIKKYKKFLYINNLIILTILVIIGFELPARVIFLQLDHEEPIA